MDLGQEAPGGFQLAIDERRVEDQLRLVIGDLRLPPRLNLALERLNVPLIPVHAHSQRIDQSDALTVFGQNVAERSCDDVSKFWFGIVQPLL